MNHSFSRIALTSSLFAFTALAGCATEEAEPVVADPTAPITTIQLDNGNELQFLEPSPGLLLVSELGQAGVTPQQIEGKRPLDIYREFSTDKKIPSALLAAQLRAEKRPDIQAKFTISESDSPKGDTSSKIVESGPRSYIDNEHCDDRWFNETFCLGSYDWMACRLNYVGNYFAQHSSADYVTVSTCADVGDITLKINMGNGSGGVWTIPEGTYRTWSWKDGCAFGCNSSVRVDIENASSDRFHVSTRVRT